ncbi:hypothetical protein NDU88_008284 [Pleurodeles waltl]|uniref:Uncharacterized protein n=1 Tax=Pleurodeles waltl TaxID=8319 RepID=A0AAV7VV24_PLEWA|nr:hypothetical protein NDU88_008284 [Pleurodeles waltl]
MISTYLRAPLAGTAAAGLPVAFVNKVGRGWASVAAEDSCKTSGGTPGAGAALPQLVVSPGPAAGERGRVFAPGIPTCDPCRSPHRKEEQCGKERGQCLLAPEPGTLPAPPWKQLCQRQRQRAAGVSWPSELWMPADAGVWGSEEYPGGSGEPGPPETDGSADRVPLVVSAMAAEGEGPQERDSWF